MIPGKLALTVWRGDTARMRVTCWADAARTTPADLSTATPTAQIRRGTALVAALACTVHDGNVIDVVLAAIDSEKLPPSGLVWDLQLSYTNGDVQTPLAGPVIIAGDATAL